jgi:hypothetical protein
MKNFLNTCAPIGCGLYFQLCLLLAGSITGLIFKKVKAIQRSINRQADSQTEVITESRNDWHAVYFNSHF